MSYMMLCIGVLILDIITKLWAELALKGAGSFAVSEGFFHFTYVEDVYKRQEYLHGGDE